jgi:hypothetical protein
MKGYRPYKQPATRQVPSSFHAATVEIFGRSPKPRIQKFRSRRSGLSVKFDRVLHP